MVGEWRRQRRRRAVARRVAPLLALAGVTAVIVVLLVGAVSQITPTSGPYKRTVDRGYVALANPLAEESNALAGELENFLATASRLDRIHFFISLDSLASDAQSIERRFAHLTPPDPVNGVSSLCASSMSARARAAVGLQGALEQVLGGPTGTGSSAGSVATAASTLESVAGEVEASDSAWASCRSRLLRSPGTPRLAGSKWVVRPSQWTPPAIERLVSAVVTSHSLAAAPAIRVVDVVTHPNPTPGAGTLMLIPPTQSLGLDIVVQDNGNVEEPSVQLTATLTRSGTSPGGSAAGTTSTRSAATSLRAGGSVTITIEGLNAAPGSAYSLSVDAVSNTPYAASPPSVSVVQVEQAVSTTLVTASSEQVEAGETVVYDATVSASIGGLPAIGGTVDFEDDGVAIPGCASQPLSDARASCSTSYPSAGSHVITAVYSGDPSRSGSTSVPLIEKVTAQTKP